MIIECPYCSAHVDAEVAGTLEPDKSEFCIDPESWSDAPDGNLAVGDELVPYRATLLYCRGCHHVLVAYEELEGLDSQAEELWTKPSRIYPPHNRLEFSPQIPDLIRDSLEEAHRCFRAGAYHSTAVMCGKAIEGLCRHFKTGPYLGPGLKELREKAIIDGMLLEWGQELQRQRNIGAHAGEATISKDDAQDVFDFALAICHYVFVLSEKFRKFKDRKAPDNSFTATIQ